MLNKKVFRMEDLYRWKFLRSARICARLRWKQFLLSAGAYPDRVLFRSREVDEVNISVFDRLVQTNYRAWLQVQFLAVHDGEICRHDERACMTVLNVFIHGVDTADRNTAAGLGRQDHILTGSDLLRGGYHIFFRALCEDEKGEGGEQNFFDGDYIHSHADSGFLR